MSAIVYFSEALKRTGARLPLSERSCTGLCLSLCLLCMSSLSACAVKSPNAESPAAEEAKGDLPTAEYAILSKEIRDLSEHLRLLESRMESLAHATDQALPAGRAVKAKPGTSVPVGAAQPEQKKGMIEPSTVPLKATPTQVASPQKTAAPAAAAKSQPAQAQAAKIPASSPAPLKIQPGDSMETEGMGIVPGNGTNPVPSSPAPSVASKAPVPDAPAKKATSGEKARYEQALASMEAGKTAEAEKQFIAFAADYPASALLPNALYWRGEALYARRLYSDAILAFKEVMNRFPNHHKAADATLKAAMSYGRLGDSDNAALHYQVLQQDYPQSPALQTARRLGLLNRGQ